MEHRFSSWIARQEEGRKKFTPEQMEWLSMIKEHIATSLSIEMEDFEYAPFNQKGGAVRAYGLFGQETGKILEELNEVLVE